MRCVKVLVVLEGCDRVGVDDLKKVVELVIFLCFMVMDMLLD